jgi:hypothetical protein
LPQLLTAADSLHQSNVGGDRRELSLAYVSAYVIAAKLSTKLGASDLSMVAAHRSSTAAVDGDSAVARGMAAYQVVCARS